MSIISRRYGSPIVNGSGGGGNSHGSGTLAARPVVPAAGDTYEVSIVDPTAPSAVYECFIAGAWTLIRHPRIPTGDAVHHWRLDQSGALVDAGSTPVSLTQTGTSWLRQQANCYRDYDCISNPLAVFGSFDRLDATISIPAGSDFTAAIAIAAPANPASAWGGRVQTQLLLWDTHTGFGDANYVSLLTDTNGGIFCGNRVAAPTPDSPVTALTWNTPHRVLYTIDGATGLLTLYIDGIARATASASGPHPKITQVCVLGQEPTNPYGAVESRLAAADVKIWHRVLTTAEIRDDWALARREF